MSTGKCPKCEKLITSINLEDIEITHLSQPRWKGISHLCPFCQSILGVQIDPIVTKANVDNETEMSNVGDVINLYAQHIQMLMNEMELIWQRVNAMLIANTIVFGFLASNLGKLNFGEQTITYIGSGGLILCFIWLILNIWGWETQNIRIDYIEKFIEDFESKIPEWYFHISLQG